MGANSYIYLIHVILQIEMASLIEAERVKISVVEQDVLVTRNEVNPLRARIHGLDLIIMASATCLLYGFVTTNSILFELSSVWNLMSLTHFIPVL